MTLEIDTEKPSDHRLVLRPDAGDWMPPPYLDFDATAQPLMAELAIGTTVVLDLDQFDYISSAGLRSIARIRKATRALGGHTLLLDPQPQVRKVFDIVKAVPVSEVFARRGAGRLSGPHPAEDCRGRNRRLRHQGGMAPP